MATIDVKDAAGSTVAVEKPNTNGRGAASASRPVVLSNEDAAKVPSLGQAAMAASTPVAIASNQSAVPVQHAARTARGRQVTTITGTSETTIVTAGASGVLRDIFMLLLSNTSSTATNVTIKDATAGTTVMTLVVPAGTTVGFTLPACDAVKQTTAANNWTATLGTGVTSLVITACYVET